MSYELIEQDFKEVVLISLGLLTLEGYESQPS